MNNPIIIEQTFDAPPETIWHAITDARRMKHWYFPELPDFKPEAGFETRFVVNANGTDYAHIWKITEVQTGKKLAYNWEYSGYPGKTTLTWELIPEDSGTKLRLTHNGIESFPQDNRSFSRESCTAGWTHIICKSLKEYLGEGEREDGK